MESWENKIIKDKLDGLQQLPAGYLPDLSSKWEIIEAGLPLKKQAVPILVKWSVAAAIVVSVFLTGIKISKYDKAPRGMLSSINMPLLHIQKLIQNNYFSLFKNAVTTLKIASFVPDHITCFF